MRISTQFSPITITFDRKEEWLHFRDFLAHTKQKMLESKNSFMFPKDFTAHEKQVFDVIENILSKTDRHD